MRALATKLRRDLWGLRGPAVATGLVVAAGLSVFVMSVSTLRSLERARDDYYDRERFAEVFLSLKRAPLALAERLAAVPGVAVAEARLAVGARLELEDLDEPASARIVSLPSAGPPALDRLHVTVGRWPEPGSSDEVLVSRAFAQAHRLAPGDALAAVLEGRRLALRVVGVALSPEFVYSIQPGQLLPDDRRFAVLWARREAIEAACDLEEAFNDACARLEAGARVPAVVEAWDRLSAPYGGLGAYGRDEQTSDVYLSEEIEQLKTMAVVPPTVFLLVAAFLLHVALGRLVGVQRPQIAALKSFGYTNLEVGRHYAALAAWLVAPGVALGLVAGAWLGSGLTANYARFFQFPRFDYGLPPDVAGIAVAVALVAALAGALGAVRRAVRLPPAEALRPPVPPRYRAGLLERWGLAQGLGPPGRMLLRNLARHPARAFFSWLGIALGGAVLVLGSFVEDSVDEVLEFQFQVAQRQDLTVTLVEPATREALHALARLPGVRRAEPFRAVPVRLAKGHRARRTALQGLPGDGALQRACGADRRPVPLPEDGVLLSARLAEVLDVRPGEALDVEVLEGARRQRTAVVRGTVADYSGRGAWMALPALSRWLEEDDAVSGAVLATDPRRLPEVSAALRAVPGVAAVTVKRAALDAFRATIAENLLRMRLVNVLFAVILAAGVVYNALRVALAERSHELASLRVLGWTRGEAARLLFGELALLTALALPAGLVLGRLLAAATLAAFQSETYRFPLVIAPSTYAFAAAVTAAAAVGAALVVRRRLDRLDLVAVLKTAE